MDNNNTFGLFKKTQKARIMRNAVLLMLLTVSISAYSQVDTIFNMNGDKLLLNFVEIVDTSIKYIETTYLPENSIPIFSASIFAFAFIIGSSILIVKAIQEPFKFPVKSVIGGMILGVVNYFSIYYLLKALNNESLESSTLFTVNNVAIVMVSTLLGLLFFKENISKINWMGIILAIISIVIVTLA